jgi:arylsulfatase A-like enzyme
MPNGIDARPPAALLLARVARTILMHSRLALIFATPALLSLFVHVAEPAPAHRVVVVVWDGMRPDFISPETTPNLARLAADGVFFAHHHPVYLSATEVNGTALATGAYPAHGGVIANTDYRPAIDPQKSVGIEIPAVVRKGDEVSGGHYLERPTVAEILHARGLATVIAGSKQVALLHDRAVRPATPGISPVLYMGETLPVTLAPALVQALGPFPPGSARDDKIERDAWTTRALLGPLWKDGVPAYSLLWLAEPDSSQHISGPGSTQSLEAIRSSDTNLGLVLAELDRRSLRATTDVFVVSDHGFSTISRKVDVAVELSIAGFQAKRAAPGGLQKGEVLVVGNGDSTLCFVGGQDADVLRRLTVFLQTQDWVGVIFARSPAEGTFPLAEAHIDSSQAPDLVVSLRWNHGKSANGAPGLQTTDLSPTNPKLGNHASLSAYDMHNTLVAAGPDIRRGVTDTLPSANTDVAPTVLWLLGLKSEAAKMDGRVLSEALTVDAPPLKSFELKRLTARRDINGGTWTQYLQVAEVNGVRYLDEGNGAFQPKADLSAVAK